MGMTLTQLTAFVTAAHYESFTEASKELNVVQSAVSHSILTLENELGLLLFERKRHSIKLTAAGHLMLTDTQALLKQVALLEKKYREVADCIVGQLTVGYCFTLSLFPLQSIIHQFKSQNPEIEISLMKYHIKNLKEKLESHLIDTAIVQLNDIRGIKAAEWRPVYRDRYMLVVKHDHPLAEKKSVHLAEISRDKLVLISPKNSPAHYYKCIQLLQKAGVAGPSLILDDSEAVDTIIMMVNVGTGVSILPVSWCNHYKNFDGLRFIDIEDEDAWREIGLTWVTTNPNPVLKLATEMDWHIGHINSETK